MNRDRRAALCASPGQKRVPDTLLPLMGKYLDVIRRPVKSSLGTRALESSQTTVTVERFQGPHQSGGVRG